MSWKYGAYLFLSSSWFTKRYWKISFYGKHPNQPVLHFPGGKQTRDGREGLNYLSAFPRRFNKWHHKRRPRSFFGEFAQKCKKNLPQSLRVNLSLLRGASLSQSVFWISQICSMLDFEIANVSSEGKGFSIWSLEASKLLLFLWDNAEPTRPNSSQFASEIFNGDNIYFWNLRTVFLKLLYDLLPR